MVIPSAKRRKLDNKAKLLKLDGYENGTKGYRLLDEETDKIYTSRDVKFVEADPYTVQSTHIPVIDNNNTGTDKVTGVNINLQEIALQEKSQRVADTEMDKSNAVGTNEIVRGQVRADELITNSYEQQRLKRTRVMNKLIFNDDFVVNQAVLCNTVEQKQLVKLFAYIIQKNSNRL